MPDTEELWFMEERADVAEWLHDHGWQVTSTAAQDLMARYGRAAPADVEDATLESVFIEAQLTG